MKSFGKSSGKLFARLAPLTTLGLVGLAILTACSHSDSNSGDSTPRSMDLKVEELTAGGCLNLAGVFDGLAQAPQDMIVRRYTRDFAIQQKDANPMRRNFVASSAKSKFKYAEKSAAVFLADGPKVSQSGCESVTFDYGAIQGAATLKASATDSPTQILLKGDSGFQALYELKSARELELTTKDTVQDTCPNVPTFPTQLTTATEIMQWGSGGEIAQKPAPIAREYLRLMRIAVRDLPLSLNRLAIYDTGLEVMAEAMDLKALATIGIDNDVAKCPTGGGEAPSGEETTAPPAPAPEPAPSPAAASVPSFAPGS